MDILEYQEPIPIINVSFLKIFSNMLKEQNSKLLKRISEDYDIYLDELIDKYINNTSVNFNNSRSSTNIKKKKEVNVSKLCMARTSKGIQCCKFKTENCDYCTVHNNSILINKQLKYGRIDEDSKENKSKNIRKPKSVKV